MTTYSGDQGVVKVGPTPDDIVEMESFSVDISNETIEDTAKGDPWTTHKPGRNSWTAEVSVMYDPAGPQNQMIEGAVLDFEFYFIGEASGDEYRAGSGIITNVALESGEGNVNVTKVVQVQGSGELTRQTVA